MVHKDRLFQDLRAVSEEHGVDRPRSNLLRYATGRDYPVSASPSTMRQIYEGMVRSALGDGPLDEAKRSMLSVCARHLGMGPESAQETENAVVREYERRKERGNMGFPLP